MLEVPNRPIVDPEGVTGHLIRFENLPFSPELVQARWILGEFFSDDAPALAQAALENGYDGRCIRRIAGLVRPDSGDLLPLMPGFFAETGAPPSLSREEAAWILIRHISRGVIEKQISPYEGARFIAYRIVNSIWPNQRHPMVVFNALASDYEDCGSYSDRPDKRRQEIDQEIMKQASALLQSGELMR